MKIKLILVPVVLLCFVLHSQKSYSQLKVDVDGDILAGRSIKLGTQQGGGRLYIGDPNSYYGSQAMHGGYWALEYYDGGLNFWNTWATDHVGRDYDIFINYATGCVGIGKKPASGFRLDVAGSIASNGINIISDVNLKRNIKSTKADYNNLFNLQGHKYNYVNKQAYKKVDVNNKTSIGVNETVAEKESIGLIAQDVQKQFPELVSENSEGYLSIDYIGLITYMLEAMKAQQNEIQNLKLNGVKQKSANMDVTTNSPSASEYNSSLLNQNIPNPFTSKTTISYQLSNEVQSAQIMVFNMNGVFVKVYDLGLGSNEIIIEGSSLQPGMYLYTLVCDGAEIDTKRMILTK